MQFSSGVSAVFFEFLQQTRQTVQTLAGGARHFRRKNNNKRPAPSAGGAAREEPPRSRLSAEEEEEEEEEVRNAASADYLFIRLPTALLAGKSSALGALFLDQSFFCQKNPRHLETDRHCLSRIV